MNNTDSGDPAAARDGIVDESAGQEELTSGALTALKASTLTTAAVGLFVLGIFYTLYFASDFILPIAVALMLNLILTPIVRFLHRWHVPDALSAAMIVGGLIAVLVFSLFRLSEPVSHWLEEVPRYGAEIADKIHDVKAPIESVKKASEQVEKVTQVEESATEEKVVIKESAYFDQLLQRAPTVGYNIVIVIVLLYFLLASGEMFRERLVTVMPTFRDKRRAATITKQIELDISAYLFTITAINAGLGVVIGLGMWAIGLPNPLLWGVLAAILNYIPYLGLFLGVTVVTLVAVVTSPTLDMAVMAMAIYIGANLVEAQFVTPSLLGRRLTMNPVAVFLSLAFWTWIWGPIGTIMAVPILVTVKTVCDHFEALAPLSFFIAGRDAKLN